MYLVHIYKFPPRDVVDLNFRGCRKLKTGNTGVPMYISLARFAGVVPLLLLLLLYRCCCRCCTAAAAAVVPLLLLLLYRCCTVRMLLEF